jgi:hypothetical protein
MNFTSVRPALTAAFAGAAPSGPSSTMASICPRLYLFRKSWPTFRPWRCPSRRSARRAAGSRGTGDELLEALGAIALRRGAERAEDERDLRVLADGLEDALAQQAAELHVVTADVGQPVGALADVVRQAEHRDARGVGLLDGRHDSVGVGGADDDGVLALGDELLHELGLARRIELAVLDVDVRAELLAFARIPSCSGA